MMYFPFLGSPCCEKTSIEFQLEELQHPKMRLAPSHELASILICVGHLSHKQMPLLNRLVNEMPTPHQLWVFEGCRKWLSPYATVDDVSEFLLVHSKMQICSPTRSIREAIEAMMRKT